MPLKLTSGLFLVFLTLSFFLQEAMGVPVAGQKIAVSGPSPYAAQAAEEIFAAGGNVFDVAVAMALTLSVTSPYFAALGGGGFAMVSTEKGVQILDFREVAPLSAHAKMFENQAAHSAQTGGLAVATPGIPAGLVELHKTYGKLSWRRLFRPALRLAEKGFYVSGEWSERTQREFERMTPDGQKTFPRLEPGDRLKQKNLARALRRFRNRGHKGFYEGPVAEDLVSAVQKAGGVLTLKDLKGYKVVWRKPLVIEIRDTTFYLMPPPSSGGAIIAQSLLLLEELKVVQKTEDQSSDEAHLLAEILKQAFRSRALFADPDQSPDPTPKLIEARHIQALAKNISMKSASTAKPLPSSFVFDPAAHESNETTHISVMDTQGNAVAMTLTLNGNYGSGVVSRRFGVALNNEMDDFTTRPDQPNQFGLVQGQHNQVSPGRRPLSSMSPTLVSKGGAVILAMGAPGGPRIISSIFQALYRLHWRGADLDWALQAPRLHHQTLPPELVLEKGRWSADIRQNLTKRGHKVTAEWMGKVYAVQRHGNKKVEAAFDSRGEGAAWAR